MNRNFYLAILATSIVWGCNEPEGSYVELQSGKVVEIVKDSSSGYMVNKETGKAVFLYVDPAKKDTFYGRTGKVVNGTIVKTDQGEFAYNGDDYMYKDGTYKLKVEGDGDMKEKDGDVKIKVAEDGDYKIKSGDYKKKVEADGDIKIKDGNKKIKIDEDGSRKVKTN